MIFLAPIAIFIVGIIGASVVSAGQTPAQRNDDEGTAMALCQDKVKESLKSPTTAQFSRVSGVRTANLFWTVTGAVDSQNGFGAMLEDQFVCTMEVRESDGFQRTTLISLG